MTWVWLIIAAIFVFIYFCAKWEPKGQLSLPMLCPRCNGGPQGDLDCWWCGGTGYASNQKRRGY